MNIACMSSMRIKKMAIKYRVLIKDVQYIHRFIDEDYAVLERGCALLAKGYNKMEVARRIVLEEI